MYLNEDPAYLVREFVVSTHFTLIPHDTLNLTWSTVYTLLHTSRHTSPYATLMD